MSQIKEKGSSIHLPVLEGINDAYRKVRMRIFIQKLDDKVWNIVKSGLKKPTNSNREKKKNRSDWTLE